MRYAITLVLTVFLLAGCVTGRGSIKDSLVYKLDMNNDGVKEITEVKHDPLDSAKTTIVVNKLERAKLKTLVDSFLVPGRFKKLEFVDLNEDGNKQIVVYYKNNDGYESLSIYKLKNDSLLKLFNIGSRCGLDTQFNSVLSRIKVCNSQYASGNNYFVDVASWESWVWSGEKFVKENP